MGYGKRQAIFRMINYKETNEASFNKSLKYITRKESSSPEYQKNFNIGLDNSWRGIEVINNRWNPKGTRLYKHGIFSFGKPNLDPKKAMHITDEILAFYSDRYPIIYSVHTDVPKRIHSHFIMGMVDIGTGKKFNQDFQELNAFKRHFNEVVISYKLPPLKNYYDDSIYQNNVTGILAGNDDDIELELTNDVYNCDRNTCGMGYDQPVISSQNYSQLIVQPFYMNEFTNEFNKNLQKWYLIGRGGK